MLSPAMKHKRQNDILDHAEKKYHKTDKDQIFAEWECKNLSNLIYESMQTASRVFFTHY